MRILVFLLLISIIGIISCDEDDTKSVELISISIKTAPIKVDYYEGEISDLSGLVVTFNMDNGETEDIAFSDFASKGITCSPDNGTELTAESTVVIITDAKTGKVVSQAITVSNVVVDAISIKKTLTKVDYYLGEALDLSELVVNLSMNNGETKDVVFSDFASNGITCSPDNGIELTKESTAVIISHTKSANTVSQAITVSDIVAAISIKIAPTKVDYYISEFLDLSGLLLTLTMDNGATEDVAVSDLTNKGINCLPVNGAELTQVLTGVTITHSASGKNINQSITISTVTGINVKTPPTKVDYYKGEDLDLSGLRVEVTLDNGTTRDLAFSDFANGGVKTTPENGTVLNNKSTEITIKHTITGETTIQTIKFITLTDIDGNTYSLIKIGNQVWMQENLKTTKYQNGDDIGTTSPATLDISAEITPKYQWAFGGDEANAAIYGRLYTKYVTVDSRNVCPADWHVPSSTEFYELVNYLAQNGHNYDEESTNYQNKLGKAIASQSNWTAQDWEPAAPGFNSATNNSSGFTGLPSGVRSIPANGFSGMGDMAAWWSSSSDEDDLGYALNIQFFQIAAQVVQHGDTNLGFSIRCIRD